MPRATGINPVARWTSISVRPHPRPLSRRERGGGRCATARWLTVAASQRVVGNTQYEIRNLQYAIRFVIAYRVLHISDFDIRISTFGFRISAYPSTINHQPFPSSAACAAASLAIGIRRGLQLT